MAEEIIHQSTRMSSQPAGVRSHVLAMIDSGASSCARGESWLVTLYSQYKRDKLPASDKAFRFGDGGRVTSLGQCQLDVWIQTAVGKWEIRVQFRVDLVVGCLPLLIAYQTLTSWDSVVQFSNNVITIKGVPIVMEKGAAGHIFVNLIMHKKTPCYQKTVSTTRSVLPEEGAANVVGNSEELTAKQAAKLHLQLGHAGTDVLHRLCANAKRKATDETLRKVMDDCGCGLGRVALQKPVMRTRVPARCGDTVGMDVMYPMEGAGHSRPFLIMVDHLSRYTIVSRMASRKPDHVAELWFELWVRPLGNPRRILADRGPSFLGKVWDDVCGLFEVQMILIAKECPIREWNGGKIGRIVQGRVSGH